MSSIVDALRKTVFVASKSESTVRKEKKEKKSKILYELAKCLVHKKRSIEARPWMEFII